MKSDGDDDGEVDGEFKYEHDESLPHRNSSNLFFKPLVHREGCEKIERKLSLSDCSDLDVSDLKPSIFADFLDFQKAGFESIIEDEITESFKMQVIPYWNYMSKHKKKHQGIFEILEFCKLSVK